jgi:hypothetical protein
MTNRPHHRPPREPRIDPTAQRLAIEVSAQLRGCVCDFDTRHDARDHVTILHDAGCPAENTGPGLLIFPGRPR